MDFLLNFIQAASTVWGGGLEALLGLGSLVFSVYAALGVLKIRRAEKRSNHMVEVWLLIENVEKRRSMELPLALRRGDLTRAELLGRIGMVAGGKRVSISSLADLALLDGINQIVEGKSSRLVIPVTQDEFEQFDLS